ncbi:MAG: lysophospholipid acyltransferase family protein [Clostridia bacterium]
MRTIIWWAYFWGYLIYLIPKVAKAEKMEIRSDEHKKIVKYHSRKWTNKLLDLAGANVQVFGEENLPKTNAVFISNHQGSFDITVMVAKIGAEPHGFLAKAEMEKMPIVKNWLKHLECICVERKDSKKAMKSVIDAIKLVKSGASLTVFPEGTRSKCDKMGEFKSGGSIIAIKAGVPIVPITIDGTYKLLEVNKRLKITPANINITIHEPIETKNLSKEEIQGIDEKIKEIIQSKLPTN